MNPIKIMELFLQKGKLVEFSTYLKNKALGSDKLKDHIVINESR